MNIPQGVLKNMLIATGLAISVSCKQAPQQIPPAQNDIKPAVHPENPTQKKPLKITRDYCPPCGRG